MSNEMKDWLTDEAQELAAFEKLKQDNRILYEALRIAAFSVADEFDPFGTAKMHQWIEQAQKNLI